MRESTLRYAVVRYRNDRRVVSGGGCHGEFPDAVQAAARLGQLAREAAGMGYDVELLIQSPVGELRCVHVDRTVH